MSERLSHNIVDPFEDTERDVFCAMTVVKQPVTTSSIRSRILKDQIATGVSIIPGRHNIVDPFEDTERIPIVQLQNMFVVSQHRRSVRGY